MHDPSTRQRDGFALLLVIWVLAILAVLVASFAAATRSETQLSRNLVDGARARALAEAGVAEAIAALIGQDRAWRHDGTPHLLTLAGGKVRVRIEDEAGKIDLNAAPIEVIGGLCTELRVEPGTTTALLNAVAARRASAGAVAPPLAGPAPSLADAMRQTAAGAAFVTVEQLRHIPGVDATTVARLRPFLTVYAKSAAINPELAPREVLLAIPGIDPAQVDGFIASRARRGAAAAAALGPETARFLGASGAGPVTIIAEAVTDGGATFSRRAVVVPTPSPGNPVRILEWTQELAAASGNP